MGPNFVFVELGVILLFDFVVVMVRYQTSCIGEDGVVKQSPSR